MCGLCGVFGGGPHWSDSPSLDSQAAEFRLQRRRQRRQQVQLANRLLQHYQLRLSDWQGSAFMLSSLTGKRELIDHLGALWPAAERLSGRRCDPLDPELITQLSQDAHSP